MKGRALIFFSSIRQIGKGLPNTYIEKNRLLFDDVEAKSGLETQEQTQKTVNIKREINNYRIGFRLSTIHELAIGLEPP